MVLYLNARGEAITFYVRPPSFRGTLPLGHRRDGDGGDGLNLRRGPSENGLLVPSGSYQRALAKAGNSDNATES
jgi:hypothetical protein